METLKTLNIDSTEIARIDTTGTVIRVPQMADGVGTSEVMQVNLDGYEFPALTLTSPHREEVEMIINLQTGMILELFPTKPYGIDSVDLALAASKDELEQLFATEND